MHKERLANIIAWAVSALAVWLAVLVWGSSFGWQLSIVNIYLVFPLLGLVAFSLMWGHYVAGVTRRLLGVQKSAIKLYYEATSVLVLFAILLHPGLLIWRLWRDGEGLPPTSVGNYVGEAAQWALMLGLISLIIFLVFEFRRLYEKRHWWKYVSLASDGAVFLIYVHALRLGSNLMDGWYRWVWYVYGITLIISLVYVRMYDNNTHKLDKKP